MKKLSKFVSLMLSLALCLGMVSPALAASFDDLNEAISSELGGEVNASGTENGTQYQEGSWGFGWNSEANQWGVQASQGEDGSRNVQLNENVKYDSENDTSSTITVGEDQNVNLDLNDKNITGGGENDVIDVENGGSLTVTGGESTDEGTNTISGGANGIDVSGDLALDGVTVSGNETGVNVNEGGSADIQNSTITNNSIGLFFVPDSTVTFTGDQNVVTNNTSKNISGDGKVNFKLDEVTYQVDADAAESLLAGEDSVAAHGTDWILAENGTVIYTGSGNQNQQLTADIVKKVLAAAGEGEKVISGFIIPEGVTSIGNRAFWKLAPNLESVSIPESVTSIGELAFGFCDKLKSISIPRSVTSLGNGPFNGCKSLERIEILGSVKIPNYMCNGSTSLQYVKISELVEEIGFEAFKNCTALTKIELPESGNLKKIGMNAFSGCSGLTGELAIPDGVEEIGRTAFANCAGLEKVIIPTTVIKVDPSPFYNSGVKSIWVYPSKTNNGDATVSALIPNVSINVFTVAEDVTLYRNGNIVIFMGSQNELGVNDEGKVIVNVPTTGLSIANGSANIAVALPEDGATVIVNEDGSLIIPDLGKDVTVTVSAETGNEATWNVTGGITVDNKRNNRTTVLEGGKITASNGTSITSFSSATIDKDGKITTKGEKITLTNGDGSTLVIGNGDWMTVDSTGKTTLPWNSSVEDANGITYYPHGNATIENGQIISKGAVTFENESGSMVSINPAEEGDPVTVDPITGVITVPTGGSTTMNDGANTLYYPDGAAVDRQGSVASSGNVEYVYALSSGTVTPPADSNITIGSDGTITVPAGSTIGEDEYPYGATILPDGTIVANRAPYIPLPDPFPVDDSIAGTAGTTIADQEVPLAGLMPVAQLLEELRQYEKIEEIELPEDFKWIDHEYAQAIYWGLQEGLVVDTEKEPFDPDEVVTVALLREVLTSFVELYKGLENFVFTLEGEDDEIVMDLGERLTAFYSELEDYLKAQEAKAA